jgi:hypothetical protein
MATIRHLAERALVDYLTGTDIAVEIRPGCDDDVKAAPLIICSALEWAEDEPNLNWYRVLCEVVTKMDRHDGVAAFDALCSQVRDALRITDLGKELSTVSIEFVDGGISAPDAGEFSVVDDLWIETRKLELYCALTGA